MKVVPPIVVELQFKRWNVCYLQGEIRRKKYVVPELEYADLRCIPPPRLYPEYIKGLVEKPRRRVDSPVNHRMSTHKGFSRSTEEQASIHSEKRTLTSSAYTESVLRGRAPSVPSIPTHTEAEVHYNYGIVRPRGDHAR